MNIKQLRYIFIKALALIMKYENKELTDDDCKEIRAFAAEVNEETKGNEYCKNIMLDVISAFNRQELANKLQQEGSE